MILATFSGLHGHNTLPRGWCMGLSAAAYGLIFWLCFSWWGSLVLPAVLAWWVFLRGSRTENVENAYMDTISDHELPSLLDVMKAHYFTGFLSCASLYLFNYITHWGQWLGWEAKAAKEGQWRGKPVRVDAAGRGRARGLVARAGTVASCASFRLVVAQRVARAAAAGARVGGALVHVDVARVARPARASGAVAPEVAGGNRGV